MKKKRELKSDQQEISDNYSSDREEFAGEAKIHDVSPSKRQVIAQGVGVPRTPDRTNSNHSTGLTPLKLAIDSFSIDESSVDSSVNSSFITVKKSSELSSAATKDQVEYEDNSKIVRELDRIKRIVRTPPEQILEDSGKLPLEMYRKIGIAVADYSLHNGRRSVVFDKGRNTLSINRFEGDRHTDITEDEVVARNFVKLRDTIIDCAKTVDKKSPEFYALAYLFSKLGTVIHSNCNQDNAKDFANVLMFFQPETTVFMSTPSAGFSHRNTIIQERSGSRQNVSDANESNNTLFSMGSGGEESHEKKHKKSYSEKHKKSAKGGGGISRK